MALKQNLMVPPAWWRRVKVFEASSLKLSITAKERAWHLDSRAESNDWKVA